MIKASLLICLFVLTSACSIKSSFTEKPAAWNPPGLAAGPLAEEASEESAEEEISSLTTASAFTGIARANLLSNIEPAGNDNLKENVRLVIAGDSWSFFDIIYKATEKKLKAVNKDYNVEYINYTTDSADTAFPQLLGIPGAKVIQWKDKNNSQMIIDALIANKEATVLVIYLTGNDWFSAYKCDDSAGNITRYRQISKNMNKFISDIYSAVSRGRGKQDLNIVIPGYSKLNFEKSLAFSGNKRRYLRFGFDNTRCPVNGSTLTINQALSEFLNIIEKNLMLLNPDNDQKRIHFIDNFNLFNANNAEPTPVKNMLNTSVIYLGGLITNYLFIDSIHLGKKSQHKVAEKTMEYILDKKLLNK
ncbi:MAG: hypothetical protein OEY11_13495 [Gammaproteobacteria bacterium]|nr:hypothetical protein [Gammaproteobacteria bacterium]